MAGQVKGKGPNLAYYRASDVENLMKTAKHSLHKEMELIVSRAEIEKVYAESLRTWVDNARKNVKNDQLFEYGDGKNVINDLLVEGERTSARHLRTHSLLVAPDGPAKKLLHYREANYKRGEQVLAIGSRSGARQRRRYPAVHHFLDEHKRIFGSFLEELRQVEKLANEYKALNTRMNKLQMRKRNTTDPVEIKKHVVSMMDADARMSVIASKYERTLKTMNGLAFSHEADSSAFVNRLLRFELDRLKVVKRELARFVQIVHAGSRDAKGVRCFLKKMNSTLAEFSPPKVTTTWHREVINNPLLPSHLEYIDETAPTAASGVLLNKYNNSDDVVPVNPQRNEAFFDAIAKAESREEDTPTPDSAKLAALIDDVVGINDDVTSDDSAISITCEDLNDDGDEDNSDDGGNESEDEYADDEEEELLDDEGTIEEVEEERTGDKRKRPWEEDPNRVVPFIEPTSDYGDERRHLQGSKNVAIVAIKDFSTDHLNELEFHNGDEMMHMRFDEKVGMGFGYRITRFGNKHYGYYPLSHVRLAEPLDLEGALGRNEPPEGTTRCQSHVR